MTRKVVDRLLADRNTEKSAHHRLPGSKHSASGSVMSSCSPRNVIVAKEERAPFAAHFESLRIGREDRSVATLRLRSGVTLRDLIEREGEGSSTSCLASKGGRRSPTSPSVGP